MLTKESHAVFFPAAFLKSHVGESTYHVFCVNRKLYVMTGISESIAASAAVVNVILDGINRVGF